jgi:type IV secretion system protein VirB6
MGFFATFWAFLQGNVLNTVSAITSNISASLAPAAVTLATIYVMIWGYLHLRGAIEEPIMEGAKRILVLAVILGLINQKNGLSQQSSEALSTQGLQPKYRFQNRQ